MEDIWKDLWCKMRGGYPDAFVSKQTFSQNIVLQHIKQEEEIDRPASETFRGLVLRETKRRKVDDLLKNRSPEELSFATQSSIIQSGKRDAAEIVRKLSEASPQRAKN